MESIKLSKKREWFGILLVIYLFSVIIFCRENILYMSDIIRTCLWFTYFAITFYLLKIHFSKNSVIYNYEYPFINSGRVTKYFVYFMLSVVASAIINFFIIRNINIIMDISNINEYKGKAILLKTTSQKGCRKMIKVQYENNSSRVCTKRAIGPSIESDINYETKENLLIIGRKSWLGVVVDEISHSD